METQQSYVLPVGEGSILSPKFERKLLRLESKGQTRLDSGVTGEDSAEFNRAGPNESQLTIDELVDYCLTKLTP